MVRADCVARRTSADLDCIRASADAVETFRAYDALVWGHEHLPSEGPAPLPLHPRQVPLWDRPAAAPRAIQFIIYIHIYIYINIYYTYIYIYVHTYMYGRFAVGRKFEYMEFLSGAKIL